MSSSSGTSTLRVLSNRMRVPRRQVIMSTTSNPPTRSGIQPPWGIFRALAARKIMSISRKGTITATEVQSDQCQHRQTTKKAMMAVTTMVPVTASP